MIEWFQQLFTRWLSRCPHAAVSFPQRRQDGVDRCTCLDCGRELDYRELTGCGWLN